ncbi:MAG: DUF2197 domain-containing protein [Firmicutes bacterium]|nr:DUF2197 domain-containing protein [Alicyclobacillaceae bacterium]MCL6496770.1 DUF2197 domain-containing protein [Bacillota bacterium]
MRTVQIRCQLCGAEEELLVWSAAYEARKRAPQAPYICARCRDRVQAEALREQHPRGH